MVRSNPPGGGPRHWVSPPGGKKTLRSSARLVSESWPEPLTRRGASSQLS